MRAFEFYADFYFDICRCFPHVINLACKAMLAALTKMDFAQEDAGDHVPTWNEDLGEEEYLQDALKRDPVATLRSLIRAVSQLCVFGLD